MTDVTLSATPKGNGYQATVTFAGATSISSAETYPTIGEAIAAAAVKLLDMPERLDALEHNALSQAGSTALPPGLRTRHRPPRRNRVRAVQWH